MKQCPVCFKLMTDDARTCARCGWDVSRHLARTPERQAGAVSSERAESSRPLTGQEGVAATLRLLKGGLVVLVVLVLVGVLGRTLVVQNRAAQASWNVKSQLLGWKEDRRSALKEALHELEALHAELLDLENWNQAPSRVRSWREGWRQRLNGVKAAYQLTGQARFGELNVRTEEALHNLVLYLSSLERGLQERAPDENDSLERSILAAFRDAEKSLQ